MFKLSENIDPNKVFIVNRSELEGRIDSTFYVNRPDFHNTIRLSKIAKIKGGKRIPKDADYSDIDTPNLYLRVTDIDESTEFNYLNFKNISDELYEKLKRYEVFENELIISIAGTVGKTKVVKNIPNGKRIILTENCVKILTNGSILPQYLSIVLQTNFLQKQIELSYIQTTIPKLGIDKILGLKIPQIPPLEIQQQIVELYENAYTEKQQKEAEAQRLLDSIDDYLLGELGIALPKEEEHLPQNTDKKNSYNLDNDNPLVKKGRLFLTNLSEVTGKRIDPYFYKESFKKAFSLIEKSQYPICKLKDISEKITSGITPLSGGDSYTNIREGIPFIRSGNIDINGNLNFEELLYLKPKIHNTIMKSSQLRQNDLIVAIVGATIGRVGIYLDNIEANINQAIALIRLKQEINPEYMKELINSSIGQLNLNRLKRPVARANINLEELATVVIVVPPLKIQNEIATHISQIRSKANTLKQEGKEILEQAKQEVEQMILGN